MIHGGEQLLFVYWPFWNPLWWSVQAFCPFINELSLFFLLTFNNSLCIANMDPFGMTEICRGIWGRVSERGRGHWDCGFLESVAWLQHSVCTRGHRLTYCSGGSRNRHHGVAEWQPRMPLALPSGLGHYYNLVRHEHSVAAPVPFFVKQGSWGGRDS